MRARIKWVIALASCLLCHGVVLADVFKTMEPVAKSAAAILGSRAQSAGERILVVNGIPMRGEVSHVRAHPLRVMNKMLEARTEAVRTSETNTDSEQSGVDETSGVYALLDGPRVIEGPGWAMLFDIDIAAGLGLRGEEASGIDSYVTLALGGDDDRSSTVWDIKFESPKDFLDLLRSERGDVGGEELPGIARFPGSRRAMTFSEFSRGSESHMVVYTGRGTPGARAKHYADQFIREGFKLDREDTSDQSEILLLLSNGGAEVTVFIRKSSESPGKILDILQIRLLLG